MVRSSLCSFTLFLIFSCLSITWAQESSDNSEARADTDLIFFSDPLTFNESCTDLAIEDFEDTNVDPDSTLACPGAFNSLTNNSCYSQGALVPGFSMTAVSDDLIVITPASFNVTNTAAGPNSLTDNTQITFDPPETGAGLFIVTPLSSGVLTAEVYGPGDALLGSADLTMEANNIGVFFGVNTEDTIARIVLNNNGQNIGELLYELQYGDCGTSLGEPNITSTVPTLSEWGMIAMAGVLGVVGFMIMRRRKVAT